MQDRYLFRGKRVNNGKWVSGDLIHGNGGKVYIQPIADTYWLVNPATLGQCTGLKDKDGVLIFEGDIIKLCDTNPILFVVSIELRKYGWACVFRYADDNKIVNGAFLHRCKVVGNIHDSPELLERHPIMENKSFIEYARYDSRLLDLKSDITRHAKKYAYDSEYCASAAWYKLFKPRLIKLVGFNSTNPILATSLAYDIAYEHLYYSLSNCRHTGICMFNTEWAKRCC